MAATRECWACGQHKSVDGVWCILATQGPGMFVCGACYEVRGLVEAPVPVP